MLFSIKQHIMKLLLYNILLIIILNTTYSQEMETLKKATFGSGCFWCTEAVFDRIEGIINVIPGYSGGHTKNPSYRDVCSGTTGHAEVIQLTYNPDIITYEKLLEIFFKTHDPTQLNRQGNDVGTQYRSVIFYHDDKQKQAALKIKNELEQANIWDNPIVTQIEEFKTFYKAEDYHNDYYLNNPNQGYCRFVITPKIEKFEAVFNKYLKKP